MRTLLLESPLIIHEGLDTDAFLIIEAVIVQWVPLITQYHILLDIQTLLSDHIVKLEELDYSMATKIICLNLKDHYHIRS